VVAGVESMAGGVVTVRIIAKCAPNEDFPVSREIRARVKNALDGAGIRAPHLMPPYASGRMLPRPERPPGGLPTRWAAVAQPERLVP
jgi:hypothetical protein